MTPLIKGPYYQNKSSFAGTVGTTVGSFFSNLIMGNKQMKLDEKTLDKNYQLGLKQIAADAKSEERNQLLIKYALMAALLIVVLILLFKS